MMMGFYYHPKDFLELCFCRVAESEAVFRRQVTNSTHCEKGGNTGGSEGVACREGVGVGGLGGGD